MMGGESVGVKVGDPFLNRSEMWYFPLDWCKEYGGRMSTDESSA